MLTVTRAQTPPLEEYLSLVRQIFAARNFTNHGPMVCQLEQALRDSLIHSPNNAPSDAPGVGTLGSNTPCGSDARTNAALQVAACNNGTTALVLALRALGCEGKRVITTPFTYVATLSAILEAGCTPVFIDIDPDSLCISPEGAAQVLDADINADIGAVLPVHIYGNACDVSGFAHFSQQNSIPVIYDAAHAFGARYAQQALLTFGDCAIGSFHATKVFHTCEGGCVVSHSQEVHRKLTLLRAFGHEGDTHIMPGINAKMSELHAAMGLCLLPHTQSNINARKHITELYDSLLQGLPLQFPLWRANLQRNYAYYPVIFESEKSLLKVQAALQAADIIPRRYFYPSLTTLPYVKEEWKHPCPVAESISLRVLCLPLYADLPPHEVERMATIIKATIKATI